MNSADDTDLENFLSGLAFYINLPAEKWMEHIKLHKEDAFCSIDHPSGTGSMMCTRAGFEALKGLVKRRTSSQSAGRNFDQAEVFNAVRENIGKNLLQAELRGVTVISAFDQSCNEALSSVAEKQVEVRHHFPCVLAGSKTPASFIIGPVRFMTTETFEKSLAESEAAGKAIEGRIKSSEFKEYCNVFGWMVSVRVPKCSRAISRIRAELAAKTAINIVRMWFGQHHGRRMRLVHLEPATQNRNQYLAEDDTSVSLCWSAQFEGAIVEDDWFSQVEVHAGSNHSLAAWLLRDIVYDEREEFSERLIDALSWFGDASFEPTPGARVAKFVMLLERLTTTTRKFSKKRFCRRVAILSMENDNDLAAKYWAAYELYNARSSVVHGAVSQSHVDYSTSISKGETTIINSLFRSFEVYSLIRFEGSPGPKTSQGFFDQQENRWEAELKVLDKELIVRDQARGF